MAIRRTSFAIDEWYHCYNRGVEKRTTFTTKDEYARFMQVLYLCNSNTALRRDDLPDTSDEFIFQISRGDTLVDIGVYCLMPNHFHLLLRERTEGGISRFMHKVSTAYTMYFNIKHDRVGGLFIKPFRSKHISKNLYFTYVAQYIHLNPLEIFEPSWKEGKVLDMSSLEKKLANYTYSSFSEYNGISRWEKTILEASAFDLIQSQTKPIKTLLEEAAEYYLGL